MEFQKYLLKALTSRIQSEASVTLKAYPSPSLPSLVYIDTNLETETFQSTEVKNYNIKGYIKINYLYAYSTDQEFDNGLDKIQEIIDAVSNSQDTLKTLQTNLTKLNYIFFDSLNQDLLEEEKGKELYCSTDIGFKFQVL